MKVHIVKRNPNLSDLSFLENKNLIGSISQSAMGKKPIGWDAEIGDEVWIHEVGFGITKYGIIKSKIEKEVVIPKSDFTALISLYNKSKIKDRSYWWEQIQKMLDNPSKDFKYIEFQIEYKFLSDPFPCRFKFQGGWYTLKETECKSFEEDKVKSFLDISIENGDVETLKNIPTKIKVEIFNKLRLTNNDKLVIDFDHIIPRYVGGLGCFIENVQPLPKAVNRSKNKSVPLIMFSVASEYKEMDKIIETYKKMINSTKDEFSKDNEILILAEKIMKKTHLWNTDKQREFYKKVLEKYDYNYYKKIVIN